MKTRDLNFILFLLISFKLNGQTYNENCKVKFNYKEKTLSNCYIEFDSLRTFKFYPINQKIEITYFKYGFNIAGGDPPLIKVESNQFPTMFIEMIKKRI